MINCKTALLLLLSSGVIAEPPVQQYLPPNQLYGPPQNNPGGYPGQGQFGGTNQYLPPNQQYGPPGAGSGGGYGDNMNYVSNDNNYTEIKTIKKKHFKFRNKFYVGDFCLILKKN